MVAGLKAGIVGGTFFAAALGVLNYALLDAFHSTTITALQTSYSTCAGAAANGCFSTVVVSDILGSVILPAGVTAVLSPSMGCTSSTSRAEDTGCGLRRRV
jgi:hypothetical protein